MIVLWDVAAGTMSGMCLMCELEQHVRRCFDNSGSIVKPQSILQMLKSKFTSYVVRRVFLAYICAIFCYWIVCFLLFYCFAAIS